VLLEKYKMILDREDTVFDVVVNNELQYSIWPTSNALPVGWQKVGKSGSKPECLAYVTEVWTDMRPLTLRQFMDAENPPTA